MGSKPRVKMSSLNRAKQFAPFSALNGLGTALANEEEKYYQRQKITLAEDAEEELDRVMRSLNGGDKIEIEYYSGGNYRRVSGQFICIDIIKRVICIGAFSVPLDDVIRVKKIL